MEFLSETQERVPRRPFILPPEVSNRPETAAQVHDGCDDAVAIAVDAEPLHWIVDRRRRPEVSDQTSLCGRHVEDNEGQSQAFRFANAEDAGSIFRPCVRQLMIVRQHALAYSVR